MNGRAPLATVVAIAGVAALAAFANACGDGARPVAAPRTMPPKPDAVAAAAGVATARSCVSPVGVDPLAARRAACAFGAGAKVAETIGGRDGARRPPIEHLVIVVQENRSFDHYFGRLPAAGKPDVDGIPPSFTNPDITDAPVRPYHLSSPCLPADPPHQGKAMVTGWNGGKMDGFVKSAAADSPTNGHFVMGYYEEADLPFYYFVAKTYAMSDRYFGSALAGTWGNRDYLYAATSDGVTDTFSRAIDVPTIFDSLDAAHVSWGVYSDDSPRQDSIGWTPSHRGVAGYSAFLAGLRDGSLPAVAFVDPGAGQDEHPPNDVHEGERWSREIYETARQSPLWPSTALIFTYDESGGLADHVAPPKACPAAPSEARFDRYGLRVPFVLVSPWSRRGYVSHVVHDHTSILRLIELLHDLPALTARDANASALLDMFDFDCPPRLAAPPAPEAGTLPCAP